MTHTTPCVGRFAPSPSGPLHAGSLVAALASWLDIRSQGGLWHLRIEDIDAPRCRPEHADRILLTLEALGLTWDGPVIYQSQRLDRYREVFDSLRDQGALFPCACSRKQLRRMQPTGEEPCYPGTCRDGLPAGKAARTWRFRVSDAAIAFDDELLGPQTQCPARQCGDFVVLRADGLFAYQLVVVIDDADQQINQVLRGSDLLSSTGRQILLQQALQLPRPDYKHIPVLKDSRGYKLSKQNGACEIDWQREPAACLNRALQALGQPGQSGTPAEILSAATLAWDAEKITNQAI